jgi:uncharacterized protein HemX
MAERRSGRGRLVLWLILVGLGFGAGYYARDRQAEREVQEAAVRAREEMEHAGLEAIERARRAGGDLRAGAQAAADSVRAAFREILGNTRER